MKNGDSIFKRVIIVAVAALFLVVGFYIFQFAKEPLSVDNGTWGQFGDYLGGTLNPVFGFLSLIILLYVLRQNERALQMSKEELELTRIELNNSATALAEQSETLKIQRFEQTFFSLLNLYSKIASKVETQGNNGSGFHDLYVNDLSAFVGNGSFQAEKQKRLNRDSSSYFKVSYTDSNQFNIKYEQFAIEMENYISHYFRIVYNILKFINNSNIIDKKLYVNLLRAQLSKYELLLLFYNGISNFGVDKLLPLLIEFDIFQHISKDFLFDKEIDLRIFEELKQSIK